MPYRNDHDGDLRRARQKKYYALNREARIAYAREYRSTQREKVAASSKAYQILHREERAASMKAYHAAHKEERKAYSKRPEVRARIRERDKRLYHTDPEFRRKKLATSKRPHLHARALARQRRPENRRRASLVHRLARNGLSPEQVAQLLIDQAGLCALDDRHQLGQKKNCPVSYNDVFICKTCASKLVLVLSNDWMGKAVLFMRQHG